MASFTNAPSEYQPPAMWSFPPFFTLQPVMETRRKQLEQWTKLILDFHTQAGVFKMNPSTFPFFKNEKIDRFLSKEAQDAVIEFMISKGNASWEDDTKSTLHIYFRSMETIADELYEWARKNSLTNDVCTIYELVSGEEHTDSVLVGMDPLIVRKVLQSLEKKGKCQIMYGASADEDGVKFFAS